MRILAADEVGRLLDSAPARYRPLLATAAFTGLRLSELLGLVWAEVDFEAGMKEFATAPLRASAA